MRGGHHRSNSGVMDTEDATPSQVQLISPVTPRHQSLWETGRHSAFSSHSMSTTRSQRNTHTNHTKTPDRTSRAPRDSSFFTPFTSNVCGLHPPPISLDTPIPSIEIDSSSTLSRNTPLLPTFPTQQDNAYQNNRYRSTFYLRPSQDSESHASNSSYNSSRHSSTLTHTDIVSLVDRIEVADTMEDSATTPGSNVASDRMQVDDGCDPATVDGAATQGDANLRSGSTATARGRGRGASSARGGRHALPCGRIGTSRAAKRPRAQRDAGGLNDKDNDNDGGPKNTKKQKSNAPDPPVVHPVEIHRRKTSLRERLISGVYEPQAVGMRVYNMKKAATAAAAAQTPTNPRNAPREFLVPVNPRANATNHDQLPNSANNTTNTDDADDTPPNLRIAYKSTPMHQLHFSEGLVLALKQNLVKWEDKQHSEGLVFVVVHLINNDIADMHVFSTLRDATADAIWTMINEHPEAFALPRNVDADGVEIKCEKYERATSLIRDINNNRPNFVPMPVTPTNQEPGGELASGSQTVGISSGARLEKEDTLFVMMKEESPEMPRVQRFVSPQPDLNDRGELLLGDAPEPAYVFSGKFRFVSFGLKMEARRADGAVVKVSVHLKNLRKPARILD
ncbi:hypothetical protein F4860DRAFT_528780 [Xylaria cubensis]|nr:hypothetical protein F4860DRAFT_528780 [Xylaria cubensis]